MGESVVFRLCFIWYWYTDAGRSLWVNSTCVHGAVCGGVHWDVALCGVHPLRLWSRRHLVLLWLHGRPQRLGLAFTVGFSVCYYQFVREKLQVCKENYYQHLKIMVEIYERRTTAYCIIIFKRMGNCQWLLFSRGATWLQHPDSSGVWGPDAVGWGGGQPDAPCSHR